MDTTPFLRVPVSESSRASLKAVYLQRLRRLRQLRHRHQQDLNPQGLRLLDRSVFAAYCACREVGAEAEARKILRGAEIALEPLQPVDVVSN